MKLWIITVNFGDTAATKSLIDSLSVTNNIDSIKIAIADNAATSNSTVQLEKIASRSKLDISVFSYKNNNYYWPAAKKIINSLKDFYGSYPDWIIVCNNDIVFSSDSFFDKLSKINKRKFPIIGPNIINSNGEQLNPFMISPLSLIQRFYWNLYFISYPFSILLLFMKKLIKLFVIKKKTQSIDSNNKVYAVHGSAILFSNYFFNNGGWLDDNFEMYGEELTVAEIAKKLKIPITYFSELKIVHNEHNSTEMMDNRLLFNKARNSHKYFESAYLK